MLICEKLKLIYNNKIIFQDISFTIFDSAIFIIKGKNGVGKSSLLKIIAKLEKQYEGSINFINRKPNLILDHTSMNNINYYNSAVNDMKPNETLEDYILFWARLLSTENMVPGAINYLKLHDYLHIESKFLSNGIRQMARISRLLCSLSKLWILDEPEDHLDDPNILLLKELFKIKAADGTIIILATHSNKFDDIGVVFEMGR